MADTSVENKETQEDSNVVLATKGGSEGQRQAIEVAEEAREKDYVNPSFAGQLFMGNFKPELLFPFPLQSEEDRKLADPFIEKITKLLTEKLDPELVDSSREIPKEVIEELGKLGAFAIKIPKEYKGLGFSQTNYNRIIMKVASYCGSTAVLLSAHQSIGVPQPLKMFGTEEQKRKWFPKFREGLISAFALTEPDVGSDPAQMSTEAKLSEDGSHYILNGDKLWCTNGTVAGVIVVMAKTAPKIVKGKERKQISAFILDMKSPGIEILHRCNFMGLGGIYNGYLRFTNVKIPKENLIWAEGRGLAMALSTINVGRLTLPAACTGAAKQALYICRRWGNDRVQWGQPIGLHETGREKISYIAATTFAMESMTWLLSSWMDKGGIDIRIEAAMAKMFCTESMWKIADMTMQLRGGRGYEKASSLIARGEPGYPVERMLRDCRINMILEGSTEIMKLFLAREAMDPHLKRLGDLLRKDKSLGDKLKSAGGMAAFYSLWYPAQFVKTWWSGSYSDLGPLAKHFQYLEVEAHKLARTIFYYMAIYQQGLEKRQLILGRLMEIGTELFAIASACSYAQALWKKNQDDKSPIELADHFSVIASRRIAERYHALTDNDDKRSNELAKNVLNDRYHWLEKGVIEMEPEQK